MERSPATLERERAHRPCFHFMPPSGWLNDPNGVILWRGQYHLFYQHNPLQARWHAPHWGHAVSDDLVRWRHLPLALTPAMPPTDDGGCWSGCAVDDGGVPTLVYTGVKGGVQTTCLAFGDDALTSWRKYEGNPVARAPAGLPISRGAYRDPYVWREGDTWFQVVGTSVGDRGQALLYRSSDLRRWEYLQPLIPQGLRESFGDPGHIWECPNFFPLGGRHVLIVSLWRDSSLTYPVAFIGDYADHTFYPEYMQRLDGGYRCFYAPLTLLDDRGERLMWGWLQEQRGGELGLAAGWSGAMSLPRRLELADGALRFLPATELESLREDAFPALTRTLSGEGCELATGQQLELQTRFTDLTGPVGIAFHADSGERTRIRYDPARRRVSVVSGEGVLADAPLALDGEPLSLCAFLDHSVLEVFANARACLSARVYPREPGLGRAEVFAEGRADVSAEAWRMAAIWTEQEGEAQSDETP